MLIDLSVPICNTPSEPMKIKVNRIDHKKGAYRMARNAHIKQYKGFIKLLAYIKYFMGFRKIQKSDFPDGEFITLDEITMPTHMGTHVDAPFHFGSQFDGSRARTIDEIPLEWFYGNAVKLDLRSIQPGTLISKADIEKALQITDYTIRPNDIVLIWTGMETKWGTADYFMRSPGMSAEATRYLVEQGVHVIGIDAYGFDRSIPIMLAEFIKTRDVNMLWPAHFAGRKLEYVHVERMTNFEKLPMSGFKVCCFPLRLKGCDASWVRAVALVGGQ